jgi:hypothetical protein
MANKPTAPDLDLCSETPQIHPPLVPSAADETTIPVFENEESRDLITPNFAHFREDPFSFLKQISLHYSGTGWRSYNSIIGQPIFFKGFSEQMKMKVLRSAILRWKIGQLAGRRTTLEDEQGMFGPKESPNWQKRRDRRHAELEQQLDEVADGIVDNMICKFESKRFIRVCLFTRKFRALCPCRGYMLTVDAYA